MKDINQELQNQRIEALEKRISALEEKVHALSAHTECPTCSNPANEEHECWGYCQGENRRCRCCDECSQSCGQSA